MITSVLHCTLNHWHLAWPPVLPCRYGVTLTWNTTGDKRVINFPFIQFISLLRKLNIFLQDTQINRDQCIFSGTGFSLICTGCFRTGTTNRTEMIKYRALNFATKKIPVFLQITAAIQFLVIHLSFPKDSSNKHLQLCKQNAFSNSFVKQSVPSEEIKGVITNTSKNRIKRSSSQMPVRGHTLGYTGQKFSCWHPCLCFSLAVAKTEAFAIEMVQVSENKTQPVCKADFE